MLFTALNARAAKHILARSESSSCGSGNTKIQNTIRSQLDTSPRSLNIDTNGILFTTKLTSLEGK